LKVFTTLSYTFFEVMNRHDIPLRQGSGGAVYLEVGDQSIHFKFESWFKQNT